MVETCHGNPQYRPTSPRPSGSKILTQKILDVVLSGQHEYCCRKATEAPRRGIDFGQSVDEEWLVGRAVPLQTPALSSGCAAASFQHWERTRPLWGPVGSCREALGIPQGSGCRSTFSHLLPVRGQASVHLSEEMECPSKARRHAIAFQRLSSEHASEISAGSQDNRNKKGPKEWVWGFSLQRSLFYRDYRYGRPIKSWITSFPVSLRS